MLALFWYGRYFILVNAAAVLVKVDPVVPAEMIVISNASVRAGAFEAALLYHRQMSSRIVLIPWAEEPLDKKTRELGIPYLSPTELAKAILGRNGIPPSAITMLPEQVDGTEAEVSALRRFAERNLPASLIFITARSHTARSRWLLRRELPARTRVVVCAPQFDDLSPETWWLKREQSREVMVEYVRWVNTLARLYSIHKENSPLPNN